ncbi:MAG: LD-carboxypeptidase [Duncaniella sp.]|uniref:S66 peptidase family protein n=1 Tax=Duncaniella sp. TaxID=2518496 RepID=UPI0023BC85DB|nr:LD-carboxypeptidase [Duncaniella sp.]MDE6090670.1 LD-carboxypeptidase [Duncaniella sp.]
MSDLPVLTPRPLRRGDRIAIVSPAGIIKPQLVYNCLPVLADRGWIPYVGENTFNRAGTYAGTDEERYEDLANALLDPDTRAILCARGGYGCVHLLEQLDRLPLRDDPKWVVGYSDISALHALMTSKGIKSIHAPMTKHIAQSAGLDDDSLLLFSELEGATPDLEVEGSSFNRSGVSEGLLVGGNLAVVAGLVSTPFDVIKPDRILFIEDIAEPIYKVERILYTLRLSGALGSLAGLIVGQFTDYAPDRNSQSMEEMISRMVAPFDFPVAYNFPIGHVDHNVPMICSSTVRLEVTTEFSKLLTIG